MAMSAKINIISLWFPPEIGAASSRIYSMAEILKKNNFDVEIITAFPNYPRGKIFRGYRGKISTKETHNGMKLQRYWLYASNSNKAIPRILGMISFSITVFLSLPYLVRRRPDIIIVNSPPLLLGFFGVILSKLCAAKTVVNISDIWPLTAYELGVLRKGEVYTLLEHIEKAIYAHADLCLGQSREIIDRLHSLQPNTPTLFYPNLSPVSDYIDVFPDHNKGNIKIIYAGLLGNAQGIMDICRNVDFARLGVELHIYGDGSEKMLIKKYIVENPQARIVFHDPISKKELEKILPRFHALLIPLRTRIYGAVPSKIYSAIACGLPVLFMGRGEAREIVESQSLGWVSDPLDYTALAANIENLVNMDAGEYRTMRQHIAQLGKTQFNIKMQEDRLIQFISK